MRREKPPTGRVRLMIDFMDLVALKKWAASALEDGTFPPNCAVFVADALDTRSGTGITLTHSYVVKSSKDRPDAMKLDLTIKVTES